MKESYYFTVASSEEEYRAAPSHTLSLSRLLQGKSYWKSPFAIAIKRQKTFLLNHSNAFMNTIKDSLVDSIIFWERMQVLQKKGFTIYYRINSELKCFPETKFDKSFFGQLVDYSFISQKQLQEKAIAELELTADQILLLDDHEIMDIMQGNDEDWTCLDSFENVDLTKSNISLTSLKNLLAAKGNEIKSLDLSGCLNLQGDFSENLHFPQLETLIFDTEKGERTEIPELQELQSNFSENLICSLIRASPQLKTLNCTGHNELPIHFLSYIQSPKKLEGLVIPDIFVNQGELSDLIHSMEIIRHLALVEFPPFLIPILAEKDLTYLETVSISGRAESNIGIILLLHKMSFLKTLEIKSCILNKEALGGAFSQSQPLLHLETLNISNSTLHADSLGQLLSNSPQLKTLNIVGCTLIGRFYDEFKSIPVFMQLESCSLAHNIIDVDIMMQLLAKLSHLKSFTLIVDGGAVLEQSIRKRAEIFSNKQTFELPFFNQLESLTLQNNYGIYAEQITHLLRKTPHVKILNLMLPSQSGLNDIPVFARLESLKLMSSFISYRYWFDLLSNAPHLKSLELMDTAFVGTINNPEMIKLPYFSDLKRLIVLSENLEPWALSRLLKQANNLKTLHIACPLKLDNSMPIDKLSCYAELDALIFEALSYSDRTLINWLSRTPDLKTLTLKECEMNQELSDERLDLDQMPSLLKLESLDIQGLSNHPHKIIQLLKKMPYLRSINLTGFHAELRGDEIEELPDFLQLESLNLSSSAINSVTLETLLSKTPYIKNIDLSHRQDISTIRWPELTNLQVISLAYTKLSVVSYRELFSRAPHINCLDLTCTGQRLVQVFRDFELLPPLNELSTLILDGSDIDLNVLVKLSIKWPHLKALDLTKCAKINRFFRESSYSASFYELTSLRLDGSSINAVNLSYLLSKAPHLKSLFLYMCPQLASADELAKLCLSLRVDELETIELDAHMALDPFFLTYLFTHTPCLKKCRIAGWSDFPQSMLDKALSELREPWTTNKEQLIESIVQQVMQFSQSLFDDEYLATQTYPKNISGSKDLDSVTTGQEEQKLSQELDADTSSGSANNPFYLKRHFWARDIHRHPEVNFYRKTIYDEIKIVDTVCSIRDAFRLQHQAPQKIESITESIEQSDSDLFDKLPFLPQENRHEYYYGKSELDLSHQWQPLPSLSANEAIKSYHLSEPVNVKIGYSTRDNLYFIRFSDNVALPTHPVTIDFIVDVPPQGATKSVLPSVVQKIIDTCAGFKQGELNIPIKRPTGQDYLQALQTQKVGACRHRSLVFKAMMNGQCPDIPVRIVNNDCHSFVEIYYQSQWINCNLGGYPSKLEVNDSLQPRQLPGYPLEMQALTAQGDLMKKASYFEVQPLLTRIPTSALEYTQSVFSSDKNKQLLEVNDTRGLAHLAWALQDFCKKTQRPFFYIQSPDDMVCAAAYLECQADNTGILKKGPGGKLHQFLTDSPYANVKPVIIINYEHFSASDIVGFNSLLDSNASIDGTALSPGTQVIGLNNPNKPGAYDGADFTSRFDHIETAPLIAQQSMLPVIVSDEATTQAAIDLYGGADWEDILIGQWIINENSLVFRDGALVRALKKEPPDLSIHLRNAPWDNPKFIHFWQQALLTGGIDYYGQHLSIPNQFKLFKTTGYDLQHVNALIMLNTTEPPLADLVILNPSTCSDLYGQYHVNKQNHTISLQPGILDAHVHKTLNVYLTRALSIDAWAQLLDTCRDKDIHLNLTLAPEVCLPKEIELVLISRLPEAIKFLSPFWQSTAPMVGDISISSTDVDATIQSIKQQDFDYLVLDVSELESVDLLGKMDTDIKKGKMLHLQFSQQDNFLEKILNSGKKVILKGYFSVELQDQLAAFLFKRERAQSEKAPVGQLILISEQSNLFPRTRPFHHSVTLDEKKELLRQTLMAPERCPDDEECHNYSLIELQAISRYQALHPGAEGTLTWQGLKSLPPFQFSTNYTLVRAEQETRAFNQKRFDAVTQGLRHSPFVFLAGMTGVGKTSFVQHVWEKKYSKVFYGEAHFKEWVHDKTPGLKTLFIDEANISSRHWSEFESLFNDPPGILIDNEYIELSTDHKIIFAGNPVSYGGERQIPSLFRRHGTSILFEPLSPAYIYHELLKPVFANMGLSKQAPSLATAMLAINQFVMTKQQDKMLLTPREMISMATLTCTYCQNNPGVSQLAVARYYAYTLAKQFIPPQFQHEFEEKFYEQRPVAMSENDNSVFSAKKIIINENNQSAFDRLQDFLDLRTHRLDVKTPHEIQLYGGLGGLVIEGEPGMGKTELVLETLVSKGLRKGALDSSNQPGNIFYHLPVKMSLSDKRALLLKAFDEGAPVVIDEINSGSMMERLLNDLLMGTTPEGKRPLKPGFMVIGTQNPPTMAGRARASGALEHRMHKVLIQPYTKLQMVEIVKHVGLELRVAKDMVEDYIALREYENKHPVSRMHCFRDLVVCAEQHVKAQLAPKGVRPKLRPRQLFLKSESIDYPNAAFFTAPNTPISPVQKQFSVKSEHDEAFFTPPQTPNTPVQKQRPIKGEAEIPDSDSENNPRKPNSRR